MCSFPTLQRASSLSLLWGKRILFRRTRNCASVMKRVARPISIVCCAGYAPLVISATRPLRAEEALKQPESVLVKFTKVSSSSSTLESLGLLLQDLLSALGTAVRAFHLAILCGPLFLATPLALWWPSRYLDGWCDLLVWTVERCGPVSTKLGQWASTRRDLFPEVICTKLSKLQRRTRPHLWKSTEEALVATLGEDYRRNFVRFDKEPIGSGCCAQVIC